MAHQNVAVKLSGLVTEAGEHSSVDTFSPYAATILEAFGTDRVMFGSDWPVCLLAAPYEQVFGGTAAAWYGLGSS